MSEISDLADLELTPGPPGPSPTFTAQGTSVASTAPATALVVETGPGVYRLDIEVPAGKDGEPGSGGGGGGDVALYLPGVAGNSVSCPHSPAQGITGPLDVRVKVRIADYNMGADRTLMAKLGSSGQYGWDFRLSTNFGISVRWSANGTSLTEMGPYPGINNFVEPDTTVWLRVVFIPDDGVGNRRASFYKSTDDAATWEEIDTRVQSVPTSMFASTAPLSVGVWGTSGTPTQGMFYKAEVRDGIDGAVVAAWDSNPPAARTRDPQGNIWTVNGTANAWEKKHDVGNDLPGHQPTH